MSIEPVKTDLSALVQALSATHQQLQTQAVRSVDTALVVRNWLFGWHIVEFENGAAQRQALYGKNLVDKLSTELIAQGIKGVSPTNLRLCRTFYQSFQKIQQTVSVESSGTKPQPPDLNRLRKSLNTSIMQRTVAQIPWRNNLTLRAKRKHDPTFTPCD